MGNTLGSFEMPDLSLGDFSFADTANELADDIVRSLVIDIEINLDFVFVVDLNPTFDPYAVSRVPNSYIDIYHFDIEASVGVNEWTSAFDWNGLEFTISQARAILDINSTLSSHPLRINDVSQLMDLVNPPNEDSERVLFDAGLDVDFPVFLTYQGIGAGSRIRYS